MSLELHIQCHLREGGSLEDLATRFRVKHRRHRELPNLVCFKYDLFADFSEALVRECRGIILDQGDDWHVVCRTFDKFFNHGETHAAPIDWESARVQEKYDGSLIQMFHHAGEWRVATSSSPDASGRVQRAGLHGEDAFEDETFADYFWRTFEMSGGRLLDSGHDDLCFAFELMGPANRVVVEHARPSLRLLTVRDRTSGRELPIDGFAATVGIEPARSFPLTSFEQIVSSFDSMSALSQEGYVVVDGRHNRVKVKHPNYVALHHAKDGFNDTNLMILVQKGEVDEVVSSFPELGARLRSLRERLDTLETEISAVWLATKDIVSQRDFATKIKDLPFAPILFCARRFDKSIERVLCETKPERLLEMLGR